MNIKKLFTIDKGATYAKKFLKALEHPHDDNVDMALSNLLEIRSEKITNMFIDILKNNESNKLREAAVIYLSDDAIANKKIMKFLLETLKKEQSTYIIMSIINGFKKLNYKKAIPVIKERLKSLDVRDRKCASKAIDSLTKNPNSGYVKKSLKNKRFNKLRNKIEEAIAENLYPEQVL